MKLLTCQSLTICAAAALLAGLRSTVAERRRRSSRLALTDER